MIDLSEWVLSDAFPWGYTWISTKDGAVLEWNNSQQSFIINDYYVMANKNTETYEAYTRLLEEAHKHYG